MFLYWFLLPLLFGAVFTGLGLGLRRLTVPFSSSLILPLGFSLTVLICTACTYYGFTAWLAAPLTVVLALVGWFFGWRELKNGSWKAQRPWIIAALLGWIAFGAAGFMAGHPGFTGYNEIVDTSYQFDWASWLSTNGREFVPKGGNGFLNVISRTVEVGYPAGGQSVLGAYAKTFGLEIAYIYQVFMTMCAACLVAAAYGLLRQIVDSPRYAAFGAFAVGQSSTLIGYGQLGGIKELTSATGLVAMAALLPFVTRREGAEQWLPASADGDAAPAPAAASKPSGIKGLWHTLWTPTKPMFPVAVAGGMAFSCFSVTVLPWFAFLALGALIMAWRALSLRAAIWRVAATVVSMIVITLPMVFPAVKGLGFANMQSSPTEVGNLAHPLAKWASSGVWLAADHRFQLVGKWHTASVILATIVFVLAIVGVIVALRRGQPAVVYLGIACLVGMVIMFKEMGPWVQLKGMVLFEPACLLLATVGISALLINGKKRLRLVAWAGVIGLVVIGITGDVLRYGSTTSTPYARLAEARQFGAEFAGYKHTLLTDADETIEYFMRRAGGGTQFNWPIVRSQASLADTTTPDFNYVWDPDQLDPTFLSTFQLILTRHSPGVSRPPANFTLAKEGRFYDMWKRTSTTPPLTHLPLGGTGDPSDVAKCEATLAAQPEGATATIAAAPDAVGGVFDPKSSNKGIQVGADGTTLSMIGAGTVKGTVNVTQANGRYEVFLQDLILRKVQLKIDGKTIPVYRDRATSIHPGYQATISLAAGTHQIELSSKGTTLSPGTSQAKNNLGYVGQLSFVPARQLHPKLIHGPAASLTCPSKIDWVETP